MDIDFVVTWVDGNDPRWEQRFLSYFPESAYSLERYRDWGLFKYWFRAVEKYAPWVHRIFVVTDDQCPDFLNVNHPKIRLVNHTEFIPKEYLPTFNSSVIEFNLHRIKDLSEHFVYFNDDMFLNAPVTPNYYFRKGLPCAAPRERLLPHKWNGNSKELTWLLRLQCDIYFINKHFSRLQVTKGHFFKWYNWRYGLYFLRNAFILRNSTDFCNFSFPHNEYPYLKSVFEDAWRLEPEMLNRTCLQKIHQPISLTIYFTMLWQLATNKFYPDNSRDNTCIYPCEIAELKKVLGWDGLHSFCINDDESISHEDYINSKSILQDLFQQKYSEKSGFEM